MNTLPPHASNDKFIVLYPPVNETFQHYAYTLSYPESMGGTVFYVGKGKGRRINIHEWEAAQTKNVNPHKCNVIRSIWAAGEQVIKTKLAFFETNQEAIEYEVALIFLFPELTNITDGGEGVTGWVPTEETRQKISQSKKGKAGGILSERHLRVVQAGPYKGRTHSAEARRKISEAKKGTRIPEEQRRQISEFQKKRPHSEEQRRRTSEALKGHVLSEETRRKISEEAQGRTAHNKGKPMSEEQKKKLSEARKGKPLSEEHRQRLREGHKRA